MRFRPRYSLRALFVAVTLLALWLGWEVRRVQVRKDEAARIQADGGSVVWADCDAAKSPDLWQMFSIAPPPEVPWFRRWIGDRAAWSIHVIISDPTDGGKIKAELAPIKSAFPEASVQAAHKQFGAQWDPAWVREITNSQ